jgi:hypothetical protein
MAADRMVRSRAFIGNRPCRYISGNAEVAFPARASTTTTIAAAANLPTPAITTTTSTTNVADVASSTGSLPAVAAVTAVSVAIPSTDLDTFASVPTVTVAVNVATPSSYTF